MLNISQLQEHLVFHYIQITRIQFTIPRHVRAKIRDELTAVHSSASYTQWRVISDDGLTMELDFPLDGALNIINSASKEVQVRKLSVRAKTNAQGDPDYSWGLLTKYSGSPYIKGLPTATETSWQLHSKQLSISLQRDDPRIWLNVTLSKAALAKQGTIKLSDITEATLRKAMTRWFWLVKPNMTTVGCIVRQYRNQPEANALTNRKTFHDMIESKDYSGQYLVRRKLFRPGISNKSGVLFGLKNVDDRKWVRVMQ